MKLVAVWLIAFCLCVFCVYSFADYGGPLQESAKIEKDITEGRLAQRTEKALSFVIMVGAQELRKKGFNYEASKMENEYFDRYQYDFRAYFSKMEQGRDIGDHKPLSDWLKKQYDMLEMLLGVDVCKKTHLSDLKTFNHTIPVVFRPCSFPMDNVSGTRKKEYERHFNEGAVYYGLFPTLCYWGVYAACSIGTSGTGFIFLCGAAGSVAERLSVLVGDNLSNSIFERICGG